MDHPPGWLEGETTFSGGGEQEHGSAGVQRPHVLLGGSRAKQQLILLGHNPTNLMSPLALGTKTHKNLARRPVTPNHYHGDHWPNLGGTFARHFCQFGCGAILEGPSAGLLPVGTRANQGDAPTDDACSQAHASTSAPSIKGE